MLDVCIDQVVQLLYKWNNEVLKYKNECFQDRSQVCRSQDAWMSTDIAEQLFQDFIFFFFAFFSSYSISGSLIIWLPMWMMPWKWPKWERSWNVSIGHLNMTHTRWSLSLRNSKQLDWWDSLIFWYTCSPSLIIHIPHCFVCKMYNSKLLLWGDYWNGPGWTFFL